MPNAFSEETGTVRHGRYRIMAALPEHVPWIPPVEVAAAALFPPGVLPGDTAAETIPVPDLERAAAAGRLWVAVLEEKVVGFSLLEPEDGLQLLAEVGVMPEHGRRGLGSALVRRAAERARRDGGAVLYLTTFASIPWNAPLYSRLGFVPLADGEAPPAIRDILAAERARGFGDRIAMGLPLTGVRSGRP